LSGPPERWSCAIDAPPDIPTTMTGPDGAAGAAPDETPADGRAPMSATARWAYVGGAAAAVIVLDQLTKWWARTLVEPIDLIGSLRFNLVFNSGAAFSRFEGWGSVIGVVGVVVVAVLIRASLHIASRVGALCLGAVIGGAIGNLIDRAVQPGDGFFGGEVTDFIDLQWWPIFNVADIALTVGGLLLVLVGLRGSSADG
jgi:signal peptidase II